MGWHIFFCSSWPSLPSLEEISEYRASLAGTAAHFMLREYTSSRLGVRRSEDSECQQLYYSRVHLAWTRPESSFAGRKYAVRPCLELLAATVKAPSGSKNNLHTHASWLTPTSTEVLAHKELRDLFSEKEFTKPPASCDFSMVFFSCSFLFSLFVCPVAKRGNKSENDVAEKNFLLG